MAVYKRKETGRWFVKFMLKGVCYRRYVPEARNKAQAQTVEAQMRQEIYEGRHGREAGAMAFEKFVREVYRPHAEAHLKGWHGISYKLDMLCRVFKGKALRELSPMLIEGWARRRLQETTIRKHTRHPATMKNELTLLSGILSMAVDNELLGTNPCRKVLKNLRKSHKFNTECKRNRVLSDDEEARLMEALKKRGAETKWATVIALNTGMRRMEILRLRWRHIDLQSQVLVVTETKSGKDRQLPLNAEVLAVLTEMWGRPTLAEEDYLFAVRTGHSLTEATGAFHRAMRDAKLEDFRFHDLRHTFASRLPPDPYLRRDLLGHSTVEMGNVYSHTSMEERGRAVSQLKGARVIPMKGRKKA
jgi:integrase